MIQTVTGPILPEQLGVTMCHEHLAVNLAGVRNDQDSVFGDSALVRSEVNLAKDAGVNSFIEVSCNDMGRDPEALKRISEACGVNIVCATGFYLEVYHPNWAPLLIHCASVGGIDIGVRQTLSDVGATVAEFFGADAPENGTSFLAQLKR